MSRTPDPQVEQALRRAQAAGMQAGESAGWRTLFDSIAREACGCVAGLLGLSAGALLAALVLAATGLSLWWLWPIALLGALCGLVAGQRRASRRQRLVLGRLHARLRGLGADAG